MVIGWKLNVSRKAKKDEHTQWLLWLQNSKGKNDWLVYLLIIALFSQHSALKLIIQVRSKMLRILGCHWHNILIPIPTTSHYHHHSHDPQNDISYSFSYFCVQLYWLGEEFSLYHLCSVLLLIVNVAMWSWRMKKRREQSTTKYRIHACINCMHHNISLQTTSTD